MTQDTSVVRNPYATVTTVNFTPSPAPSPAPGDEEGGREEDGGEEEGAEEGEVAMRISSRKRAAAAKTAVTRRPSSAGRHARGPAAIHPDTDPAVANWRAIAANIWS